MKKIILLIASYLSLFGFLLFAQAPTPKQEPKKEKTKKQEPKKEGKEAPKEQKQNKPMKD